MTERTLSIIKPDAVSKSVIGEIYSRFEKAGLKIIAAKMVQLDEDSSFSLLDSTLNIKVRAFIQI